MITMQIKIRRLQKIIREEITRISRTMFHESMMNYDQWGLARPQYEICPECDGTGSVRCPECINTTNKRAQECDMCNGSKQIECEICATAAREVEAHDADDEY